MKRSETGFVLVQVLIAMALLAIMSTLGWMTIQRINHAKQQVEQRLEWDQMGRLTLERMARDLSMAYLSTNQLQWQASETPRTFFQGTHQGNYDNLRFTYFGHVQQPNAPAEADTAAVAYVAQPDEKERSAFHLVRYETPRIQAMDPRTIEQGALSGEVLCTHLTQLEIWYYDPNKNQWVQNWSTQGIDGYPRRLPSRIRIKLVVQTGETPSYFVTEVRPGLFQAVDTSPKSTDFR